MSSLIQSRTSIPSILAILAILSFLSLPGCRQPTERHAGTSHETETGNQITGTLQAGSGIPASGLRVHLRSATYSRPELALTKTGMESEFADSVLTDGKGFFRFLLKQGDTGSLVLEALGDSSSGIRVPIEHSLPRPRDLGIRMLGPTGSLRGEIVLPPGEVGFVLIQLLGTARYSILDSGSVDFSFPNLPSGSYTGRAMGFRPPRAPVFFQADVPAGGTGKVLALNLEKASGAVRGRILMPAGTRGSAEVEAVGTGFRTRTDSAGRFYLSGLAEGEHRLRAYGLVPRRDTVEQPVSVRTGEVSGDIVLQLSRLSVLIVDGANNHDWARLTRGFRSILAATGRFNVDVSTSPPPGSDSALWSGWSPAFGNHDAILLNYSDFGQASKGTWPPQTRESLRSFVAEGGGLVVTQTSQSAFYSWDAYRDMLGLAWGNQNVYPGLILDSARSAGIIPPGQGASYTLQAAFLIQLADSLHPITRGIPPAWRHTRDVVDLGLRGPARNMTVLSYLSHPVSGRLEPVEWTVAYGKGRVYNISLGDVVDAGPDAAIRCAGFQTMLGRGAEWAATGGVTLPVPADFPTEASESLRDIPPGP